MELVRGLHNLRPRHRGCVATIGNYDGLHLGHQAMLRQVKAQAKRLGVAACVLSFEPSPREYLAAAGKAPPPPARLSRFREKFQNLNEFGIDRFVCARFDTAMQSIEAPAFVRDILVAGLGVRWLVVGDDFRFAKARAGTVDLLREMGADHGYGVDQAEPYLIEGQRVSSSLVREALAVGDLPRAATLLGRCYRMSGRVSGGQQLGRKLGFPTANLRVHRRVLPMTGVFAVRVTGSGLNAVAGVASLGTRPTVNGVEPLLEAHVFDYDGDLYGRHLHVDFVARLREEVKFPNVEELVEQMKRDASHARQLLDIARDP